MAGQTALHIARKPPTAKTIHLGLVVCQELVAAGVVLGIDEGYKRVA